MAVKITGAWLSLENLVLSIFISYALSSTCLVLGRISLTITLNFHPFVAPPDLLSFSKVIRLPISIIQKDQLQLESGFS